MDDDLERSLSAAELDRVLGVLRSELGLEGELESCEVIQVEPETRLRFNAPTPVLTWRLRLHLAAPQGAQVAMEVELFQWLVGRDWEVCQALPL